ncbi:insulinase family protein [Nocardiopsis aegyptia]|uniref:M16 family metallopeptidase n=1 Tax=Nocardiopsis aegyptia TaxID=220378 RepID=UPI0036716069
MSADARATSDGLVRERLPNGLTVLLAPDRRWPRVAVTVHYGVGFRAEAPGQEGLAHLFEHLMFQGSESLPDGRFHDHVHSVGGTANGTTHQDYTDYYQVVPEASLERAIFGEADRMRAPAFTDGGLALQLEAVAREIHQATVAPPFGGLPWPLLPAAMFDSFPNAHDGYGDVDRLRVTTVQDCADFFEAHYTPGNAVLTVTGGFDPDRARTWIHEHFADVPARPRREPPAAREEPLRQDRWVVHTRPGVRRTALSAGFRLPDPATDLRRYLAHVVLADLVAEANRAPDGRTLVDAGCGFFGPLDARAPDALVMSTSLPPDAPGERLLEGVRDQLRGWAAGADLTGDDVALAVAGVARGHHLAHADLAARGRGLGRMEILFGRAELLDEVPRAVREVTEADVREAAAAVADQPAAVTVIGPGTERSRPRPVAGAGTPGPSAVPMGRDASRLARTARGPRPLPPLGPQWTTGALGAFHELMTPHGVRLVAVHDDRTPFAQIRARLPLGPRAWADPEGARALTAALEERARLWVRAGGLREDLSVSTDGQWLDVTGVVEASRVDQWLDAFGPGMAPLGPIDVPHRPGPAPAAGSAEHAADDVLRRHWMAEGLRGHDSAVTGSFALADAHQSMLSTPGGVLVVVGDVDPRSTVDRAERAMSGWPAAEYVGVTSARPIGARGTGPTAVHAPGPGGAGLTLSAPEPLTAGSEASRYLACAVFGGYAESRLVRGVARKGADRYMVSAGRDTLLDRPRTFVRARLFGAAPEEVIDDVASEAARVAREGLDPSEVDRARDYCLAQLLVAYDSPALLADVVRSLTAAGHGADWIERLPGALTATPATEVEKAVRGLFAGFADGRVRVIATDADGHGAAAGTRDDKA